MDWRHGLRRRDEPPLIPHPSSLQLPRLYTYVVRYDNGVAPNPFWGTCTLAVCKPAIRRTAQIGDWILGTGSKQSHLAPGETHDLSGAAVYAMQVTGKMPLAAYDQHCRQHLPEKIPDLSSLDWRCRVGDCLYDFGGDIHTPALRPGYHEDGERSRDLGGVNVLLSDCFAYFGAAAPDLPASLQHLVHAGQGHRGWSDAEKVAAFEKWFAGLERNRLYGEPQLTWEVMATVANLTESK